MALALLNETANTVGMNRLTHVSRKLLVIVCFSVAAACGDTQWEGTSTNTAGDFRYGAVTFTVKGDEIVDFRIKGVTTSGCGGLKDVLVPSGIKINGTEFGGSYQPIEGVDDTIIVRGAILGKSATGTFSEGPTCRNSGKFSASAR